MKYITLGVVILGVLGGTPSVMRWYEEASRPTIIIINEAEAKGVQEREEKTVLIEVRPTVPEELKRIADCESGTRTKDGKAVAGSARQYNEDGSVLIGRLNKPEYGVDIGKYQINEVFHGKRAKELGLDLYSEYGNEKYALMLYEANGTRDWSASRSCWSR